MGELIGLAAVVLIFGVPIVAIITSHQQKLAEMRMKAGQQADAGLLSEIQDLKRQMTDLRDTTTKYDLSFDAALQRIESRVGGLEGRVSTLEQGVVQQR